MNYTDPYATMLAAIAMSLPAPHGERYARRMRHDPDVARAFRESFSLAYDAMRYDPATY